VIERSRQPTRSIQKESQWRYFKGWYEPGAYLEEWRQPDFLDDPQINPDWMEGNAPVGYDGNWTITMGTTLGDMSGGYTTIYLRKEFTIDDPSKIDKLILEALYDDGFNAWINGTRVAFDRVKGEDLPFDELSNGMHDPELNRYIAFELPKPYPYLRPGRNILAIQQFNVYLVGSSDCFFDGKLTAAVGGRTGAEKAELRSQGRKYEIEPAWSRR
jgi:hypothetical protein